MQKEKDRGNQKRDVLPEAFASISEAASFWESHDSTDYEDIMEEVEFDVNIKRRIYLVYERKPRNLKHPRSLTDLY